MAEALIAVGLAGNIVQFISFWGTLMSKSEEIYKSTNGALVEHLELEAITTHLDRLVTAMAMRTGPPAETESEKQLQDLCRQCRDRAEELLRAVTKLKVNGKSKKWRSFRQALNSVWSSDRINFLSARLEAFRRQVDTTLLVVLREQSARANRDQAQKLESINDTLINIGLSTKQWQKDLVETLHRENWQPENPRDIEAFSTELSSAAKAQLEDRATSNIMHLLDFYERPDRFERIKEAHTKTFEWIFRRGSVLQEAEQPALGQISTLPSQKTYWHSFADWLESDGSIYWITGKPGSGKSTLMKFIQNDSRTVAHLQGWISGYELIQAGWFFWNSGTAIQMSRMGLLQALLYQLLEKHPELIAQIFPRRWKSHELFGTDLRPLTWLELVDGLKKIILQTQFRYFFVIDGLDEFDGDTSELLELLMKIAASPNVKVCVASRPWLIFEEALKGQPMLQLQYLTTGDIELYASQKLLNNSMFAAWQTQNHGEAFMIFQTIKCKAAGVFLWVYLVVSSLLEGLRDGDRPSDLRKRVEELPSDLEELFKKILSNLEPRHFDQASQLLQIVEAALAPLSLLSLYFAEEGFDMSLTSEVRPLTTDEISSKVEIMRRRILSRCKGLLEPRYIRSESSIQSQENDKEGGEVSYLHRTVKDFLQSQEIWDYIVAGTGSSFDPNRSLCGACVFRLKTMAPGEDMIRRIWRIMPLCMKYAKALEESSGEPQVLFLHELDRLASWFLDGPEEIHVPQGNTLVMSPVKDSTHWTELAPVLVGDVQLGQSSRSILEYALGFKLYLYVDWRLSHDIPVTYDLCGRSFLSGAIEGRDLPLVELLLKHKADPNRPEPTAPNLSPWYCAIMMPEWDRCWRSDSWLLPSEAVGPAREAALDKIARIVELLLLNGADPWITLPAKFRECDHCLQVTSRAQPFNADQLVRQIFSQWSNEWTNHLLKLLEDKRRSSPGRSALDVPKEFICLECQRRMYQQVKSQDTAFQVSTRRRSRLYKWMKDVFSSPTK
ncbi:uncharacterized protein BDR25DRAFT_35993 [Lindgomyces ingoldianus]|uniref:Uncharacterized protein n=1 Tax=Lindgomyces ingoldianus TaxID=673940 RepID=A0ACB6QSY8_9PLEO|nr:uncharacterized protein BDR25DRAFT_35993 [Lindgomyces ingoldianus]KAF2470006.1 hypothetical protein BDR25DRAFT_35993 [Lindgomyces ingoldianus]